MSLHRDVRRLLIAVAGAVLMIFQSGLVSQAGAQEKKPNIIFIMATT